MDKLLENEEIIFYIIFCLSISNISFSNFCFISINTLFFEQFSMYFLYHLNIADPGPIIRPIWLTLSACLSICLSVCQSLPASFSPNLSHHFSFPPLFFPLPHSDTPSHVPKLSVPLSFCREHAHTHYLTLSLTLLASVSVNLFLRSSVAPCSLWLVYSWLRWFIGTWCHRTYHAGAHCLLHQTILHLTLNQPY